MSENIFGVAVKAFIIKGNKILVLYKTPQETANTLDPNLKRDQPGGRLEFGEVPKNALKREVYEETKLDVEILFPIQAWTFVKDNFQLVGINYLCEWKSGEVILSEEHEKHEWLTLREIEKTDWFDKDNYIMAFMQYKSLGEK